MTYQVEITPAAKRQIKKLIRTTQELIIQRLEELAENPRPSGVHKMEGEENLYRVRVGDYRDTLCYGQTQEHAIAIALEQLANHYRQIAEQQQNRDWDAVERTEAGDLIAKHYYLILHYERIAEAESKFEAMHDTIMGNTVVENAKITVVEIAADLPIEPLIRFAQED